MKPASPRSLGSLFLTAGLILAWLGLFEASLGGLGWWDAEDCASFFLGFSALVTLLGALYRWGPLLRAPKAGDGNSKPLLPKDGITDLLKGPNADR